MNRLFLTGNGFDLAHGLKTSYKDFIFWYLVQCFDNAGIYNNGLGHEDQCIRVSVRDHHKLMELAAISIAPQELNQPDNIKKTTNCQIK